MREATDYFSRPGFRRLFHAARKKIESLGRIGGEVRLSSLTPEEQEALSGLLAKSLYRQNSIVVRLSELDERLRETRFAIGLLDLLNGLFGEEIKPNRLKRMEQEEKWKQRLQHLKSCSGHLSVRFWLSRLEEGVGQGYRTLRDWFERHEQNAPDADPFMNEEFYHVIRALDNLPAFQNRSVRLPIFAASISGDPHFLDRDRLSGRLFYYGMAAVIRHWRYGDEGGNTPEISEGPDGSRDSEAVRMQYQDAGLLLDDLSSFVWIAGVDVEGEEYSFGLTLRMVEKWSGKWLSLAEERMKGKEEISAGRFSDAFCFAKPGSTASAEMSVDRRVDASRPLECFLLAALHTGKIYLTENPSVLSGILDRIQACDFGKSSPSSSMAISSGIQDRIVTFDSDALGSTSGRRHPVMWSPLACTSGQPSHAAIRLFDFLIRLGIRIHYSGDFDLKGLEMAAALQKRYGDLWNAWGLKQEALRYLNNLHSGALGSLRFSEEEYASVKRLDLPWEEELPEALGHTKVFEEMIFSYLWNKYKDGHLDRKG